MSIRLAQPLVIASILAVLLAVGWLSVYEDYVLVQILAPKDQAARIPVFAQYIVTQSLQIDTVTRVTKLIIPMYIPRAGLPFKIHLINKNILVYSWDLPIEARGLVDLELPLKPGQSIEGELQVELNGRQIDENSRLNAPQIFIESADNGYPAGNYRIAANNKKGDIALTVIGERRGWHSWQQKFSAKPLTQLAKICSVILLTILIGTVTSLLAQIIKTSHKSGGTV